MTSNDRFIIPECWMCESSSREGWFSWLLFPASSFRWNPKPFWGDYRWLFSHCVPLQFLFSQMYDRKRIPANFLRADLQIWQFFTKIVTLAERPAWHIWWKCFRFILDSKSGKFLMDRGRHYVHHLVWCTVHSAQSPYGCGVLFICPKAYQSPESDKRNVLHTFVLY